MKPIKGWVVVDPDGENEFWTLRYERKDAVKCFLVAFWNNEYWGWKYYYKQGYRCIRVTLRED